MFPNCLSPHPHSFLVICTQHVTSLTIIYFTDMNLEVLTILNKFYHMIMIWVKSSLFISHGTKINGGPEEIDKWVVTYFILLNDISTCHLPKYIV